MSFNVFRSEVKVLGFNYFVEVVDQTDVFVKVLDQTFDVSKLMS
jgi:hypothetical protein